MYRRMAIAAFWLVELLLMSAGAFAMHDVPMASKDGITIEVLSAGWVKVYPGEDGLAKPGAHYVDERLNKSSERTFFLLRVTYPTHMGFIVPNLEVADPSGIPLRSFHNIAFEVGPHHPDQMFFEVFLPAPSEFQPTMSLTASINLGENKVDQFAFPDIEMPHM